MRRLEADQMLMLRIAASGWDGKDFETLAEALFAYGYQVLIGWILTGKVFGELRRKNIAKLYSPASGLPRDQAMELAFDTLQESVVKFRDRVLKRNRWNPGRGATLKTFFIGFCLFIFPNFYRSWLVSWHNPANSDTRDPVLDPLPVQTDPESRTEEVALARATLAGVQDEVDQATLDVLRLRVERFTFKEIGEMLSISEARAKTLAHRYRPQRG